MCEKASESKKTKELRTGLMLITVCSFMLCFFEPLCIYFQNSSDFIFDIYTLCPVCLVLWGGAVAFAGLIFVFINKVFPKCSPYLTGVGFAMYLYLYIQGNFLAGALPLLDGSPIDWSRYSGQNIQSVLLGLGVLAGTVSAFVILKKDRFCSMVRVVSGIMAAMFAVTLSVTGYFNYGFDPKPAAAVTSRHLTDYSPERNFVILVVDMLDVEYENQVLEQHPEDKEFLKDFTYYDNVVSAYCYTDNSLPFLLGGKWYEGREKFDDYKEWSYLHSPLVEELRTQGYALDIYTDELTVSKEALSLDNTMDVSRRLEDPVGFGRTWLRFVAFKYLPYPLKKYCQVLPEDFTEPFSNAVEDGEIWDFYKSNELFYKAHAEGTMNVAEGEKPQFKFIHIQGAHYPYHINRALDFGRESTYLECVEGTNMLVKTWLDSLKEAGVYENSVILIMADHGTSGDNPIPMGHQDPVLLIKGIGETHEAMRTDSAPISQEDYLAAYFRLLSGAPGDQVFEYKAGDVRERRCLVFQNGRFDEYLQKGHASDLTTFLPTGKWYLPLR